MRSTKIDQPSRGGHMPTPCGTWWGDYDQQEITLVLVTPVWKSQSLYMLLVDSDPPLIEGFDHPNIPRESARDSRLTYLT